MKPQHSHFKHQENSKLTLNIRKYVHLEIYISHFNVNEKTCSSGPWYGSWPRNHDVGSYVYNLTAVSPFNTTVVSLNSIITTLDSTSINVFAIIITMLIKRRILTKYNNYCSL